MSILAGLKISTKILILLLMLGVVTFAVSLAGSRSLVSADDANTEMVKASSAPIAIARANRNATEMSYAAYRVLVFDGASKEAKDAAAAEEEAYAHGKTRLEAAVAAQPSLKVALADINAKLDNLHEVLQRSIRLVWPATPTGQKPSWQQQTSTPPRLLTR